MMTLNSLNLMVSCKPPISVHLEGDMLWDWSLLKGTNKHLASTFYKPFCRRRRPEPVSDVGKVKVGHCEGLVWMGVERVCTCREISVVIKPYS